MCPRLNGRTGSTLSLPLEWKLLFCIPAAFVAHRDLLTRKHTNKKREKRNIFLSSRLIFRSGFNEGWQCIQMWYEDYVVCGLCSTIGPFALYVEGGYAVERVAYKSIVFMWTLAGWDYLKISADKCLSCNSSKLSPKKQHWEGRAYSAVGCIPPSCSHPSGRP